MAKNRNVIRALQNNIKSKKPNYLFKALHPSQWRFSTGFSRSLNLEREFGRGHLFGREQQVALTENLEAGNAAQIDRMNLFALIAVIIEQQITLVIRYAAIVQTRI